MNSVGPKWPKAALSSGRPTVCHHSSPLRLFQLSAGQLIIQLDLDYPIPAGSSARGTRTNGSASLLFWPVRPLVQLQLQLRLQLQPRPASIPAPTWPYLARPGCSALLSGERALARPGIDSNLPASDPSSIGRSSREASNAEDPMKHLRRTEQRRGKKVKVKRDRQALFACHSPEQSPARNSMSAL